MIVFISSLLFSFFVAHLLEATHTESSWISRARKEITTRKAGREMKKMSRVRTVNTDKNRYIFFRLPVRRFSYNADPLHDV